MNISPRHPFRRILSVGILLLAASLLLLPAMLGAEELSVDAEVDSPQTTLDAPIQLSVTLHAHGGEVDTTPIRDFKILGQSTSASLQIINGTIDRKKTFIYTLLPLREGSLTIPPLTVSAGKERALTRPLSVQVTREESGPDVSSDIQVSGTLTETRPYLGQGSIYTFRLLYAVPLTNIDYDPPSFEGFTAVQIGKQTARQTAIAGRPYQEITLSYLLTPLRTGIIPIGPATLHCEMEHTRSRSRAPFDSFFDRSFSGRTEQKVLRTEEIPVDVLPLPPHPEPVSGLMGHFEMKAELEPRAVSAGESATLSLTLSGQGNLQDAEAPPLQIPDAFKQYPDQPQTDVTLSRDGYSGKKVFKTALVPVRPGTYSIAVPPIITFDPEQKAYVSLSAPPLAITVLEGEKEALPGVSAPDAPAPPVQKQQVDFTGRDILPIKTGVDALTDESSLPTFWFLMALLAPGGVVLISACVRKRTRQDNGPAAVMARKALDALSAAGKHEGQDSFFSHLHRALRYAVFAKAGTLGESLTLEEVRSILSGRTQDPSLAEAVVQLFIRLESARFGKTALSSDEQSGLQSETHRLIRELVQ